MLADIAYPTIVKVHIGPLAISPHGVGIAVGFLAGARLLLPEAERKGIHEDEVYPLLIRAFIGALIGARLAYVINHIGDYSSPLDALKVWQGGISLLGGFIGAILLALPADPLRAHQLLEDHGRSRAGHGAGCDRRPHRRPHRRRPPRQDHQPRRSGSGVRRTSHRRRRRACRDRVRSCTRRRCTTSCSTIILLGVLLWLRRNKPRYDGFLITLFGAWYGCQRILEDFLREDKHIIGTAAHGLTGSQVTSIITVLVCVWHMVFVRRTPRWGRWDELPPKGDPPDSDPSPEVDATDGTPRAPPRPPTPRPASNPSSLSRPVCPGPPVACRANPSTRSSRMDVRIGVTQTPREIEIELGDDDGDKLVKDVEAALAKSASMLWVTDRKGRRVGIPAEKIAYVEIGTPTDDGHRVGFGVRS